MTIGSKAINYFSQILPGWSFCLVNVVNDSEALLSAWNESFFVFNSMFSLSSIILEGFFFGIGLPLKIFNCYKPYSNWRTFGEEIDLIGVPYVENLIVGGDLNLAIANRDIWGHNSRLDTLAGFFNDLFLKVGLVDVVPTRLMPT